MANPFGELVNDEKLDQMQRYVDQPKTQEERARVAMYLINDKAKNSDVANYVQWVSALCVVYNGTGDTIHYVADHDWYGYIGRTPYPVEIRNGQWAGFLHVHRTSEPSGSEAAVVYRGKNSNGEDRDFLIAWNVPWGWSSNTVYCAVGEVNSFQNRWDDIYNKLNNGKKRHTSETNECSIVVDIASGTSPVFRAVIKTPYSQ